MIRHQCQCWDWAYYREVFKAPGNSRSRSIALRLSSHLAIAGNNHFFPHLQLLDDVWHPHKMTVTP